MKVLIACEESQEVCKAFRAKGHEAYSCDIQDCSGGHPDWHLKMDAFLALYLMKWDLIILHPPCTHISVSGNRYYAGTTLRIKAATWAQELYKQATNVCDKVAMENPVGVLNSLFSWLPEPQYVDLWWFGTEEMKKTGWWKRNLPDLEPTNNVGPPPEGKDRIKWQKVWYQSPSKLRGKIRSKLDPNMAKAIAEQWG